jgi:hypothetical protein
VPSWPVGCPEDVRSALRRPEELTEDVAAAIESVAG